MINYDNVAEDRAGSSSVSRICVVGLGYIGLPTASLLATKGFNVLGVDVSEHVVNKINHGEIHIVEPGLDILVKSAIHSQNLKASLQPAPADVFILAVPTPFTKDKKPDLSYVKAAAKSIAKELVEENLVILESTSPVGATELVRDVIQAERPDLKAVYYAHCPERVIPGKVLQELVENDRVVGGIDEASTEKTATFYETFVHGKVLRTNARTAELCKLTENASRDVNIAFANELSLVCDELNINVWDLIHLANHHPRVNILQPGPGVGGHCIAVDPWFIISSCPEQAQLMTAARAVNDGKPDWVIGKVKKAAAKFKAPVIACLGLAFKANIDDLRESPAKMITQKIIEADIGQVIVCEPNVRELEGFHLVDLHTAVEEADIFVILVDHKEFLCLNRGLLDEKIVIDTKGMLNEKDHDRVRYPTRSHQNGAHCKSTGIIA